MVEDHSVQSENPWVKLIWIYEKVMSGTYSLERTLGWAGILNTIRPDYIKIVCPTAPSIPVSLNNGFVMPAWYDIQGIAIVCSIFLLFSNLYLSVFCFLPTLLWFLKIYNWILLHIKCNTTKTTLFFLWKQL